MLYEATVTSINGKGVYMRKAPRKNGTILNTLPVGTKVEVLAEVDDDWCEIRQAGTDGYMMRMYLKRENGQNGSAVETIRQIRALLDTLEQQIGGA